MRAIMVANGKGGCGKTTFAITVAAAIAARGDRVGLADADPQRSALTWLGRRPPSARDIEAIDWTRTATPIERGRLDWLVVDAPAGFDALLGEPLLAASSAIIAPIAPSFFDAHAAQRFLLRIENAAALRNGRAELFLAANRVRPGSRAAERLEETFRLIGTRPSARVTERASYDALAHLGLSVFDREDRDAVAARRDWAPLLRKLGAT